MSELSAYVQQHTRRNARGTSSEAADLVFFEITLSADASSTELCTLLRSHKGEFNDVNVFDGQEHGFIELGGWLGDQGIALELIGLGSQLGLWQLLTPKTVLGADLAVELEADLAEKGLISLIAPVVGPAK
ncbi:MAG: hypothetical protein Q7U16_10245 [Agitococcus sp.]|nr:hypothetical protein [Agitococcus sp.]